MTPDELEAIRERAEAATPGPWEHDPDGFMGCGSVWCASDQDSLFGGPIAEPSGDCYPRGGYAPKEDMVFIAHARADVPALLAALAEAQRERDELALAVKARDIAVREADQLRVAAEASVELMRPVVEAAKAWRAAGEKAINPAYRHEAIGADVTLAHAVQVYETEEKSE